MTPDYLKDFPVSQVAGWYRRLATAWERGALELQPALAGVFLRTWVDNRNPSATYAFEAPTHVRSSRAVVDVQIYHRSVFLTEKKGRVGNDEKWVGILPATRRKVPDGANPPKDGPLVDITFKTWSCSVTDRYDWNYSEWRCSSPGSSRMPAWSATRRSI